MAIIRTYGTCLLKKDGWEIEAEPQVLMRLRRHFPRVQNEFGVITMKDTEEVCFELRWFMERYPLQVDELDYLEDRADAHEQNMRDFHLILSGKSDPRAFEMALPPREYQQVAADLWLRMGSLLLADDVGLGKQMPLDTKVLTPRGWVEIGSIRVGDTVTGSNGRPTRVTGVFPQGVRDNYRVSFSDGSSVEAGDEHLWTVRHRIGGRRFEDLTVTTKELRTKAVLVREHNNGRRTELDLGKVQYLHLPMLTNPVVFTKQKPLPIPPYALGALIGNGSLAHGRVVLSAHAEDAEELRSLLLEDGIAIGVDESCGGLGYRFSCLGLTQQIRALKLDVLSDKKHIPSQYKTSKPSDRVALLNGLMDTDGSCSKTGNRLTYHTISSSLADDVVELVECLGGIATKREHDRSHEGKGTEYSVRIRLPAAIYPFRLSRKASRFKHTKGTVPRRTLTTIEYTRTVESVCIRVAAQDSLYVTEHAILTHNTCSSICGLTEPITRPALIVTLTHLPSQWQEEIEKFAPSLKTHIIRKGSVYDIVNFGKRKKRVGAQLQLLNDVDAGDFPDVLICNYHKLHGWAESLSGVIKSVIYDECQELRHPGSKKHNAAKLISEKCDFRLGLSATPIYNYGGEIFHVMEAVNPGALGSRDEFLKEWCYNLGGFSGDKHAINDPQAFGKYMRDQALMLRRTRADVKRELPPISNIPHTVDVDSRIIDNVADDAMALARLILGEGGKGIDKMEASQELSWKLRQATGIAKAPYVAEFVKMLLEQGEQVLVYAWHREVYAILQERLKEYNPRLFTGSESPAKKKAAAQSFKDGNCKVMLMSLRSGAGLDGLQHVCNTVVYAELDWSPGVHEQATGRIARDGQTNPVFAYYLTSETGSDPVVSEALGLKRQQVEGLRTPDGDLIEELQTDGKNIKRLAEAFIKQRKGK